MKKEKLKSIIFKNREIKITKDRLLISSGIGLIFTSVILLGVFSWAGIIFNGNFDSKFWSNYLLTLGSIMLGFAGTIIARLMQERKKPQYIIVQQKIKDYRETITKNKKINQMKYWLKWIYNYNKKVEKLQDILVIAQDKLKIAEMPKDDIKEFSQKKYDKLLYKYNVYMQKKQDIEKHLKTVDIHFDVIELYKKNKIEEAKALYKSIEDDILAKTVKKVPTVTYAKLFNGAYKGKKDESIDINYSLLITKKVMPKILLGVVWIFGLTSIIPDLTGWSMYNVILILIKLAGLVTYIILGLQIASDIALTEFLADNNRTIICDTFKEDLEIYGGYKWQEIDERENEFIEEEIETNKEEQDDTTN